MKYLLRNFLQDPIEQRFFGYTDNAIPKVLLIHSNSMQVADARLKVYETFKSYIEPEEIFLHHEYEEIDDIARWIACQKIESTCAFVKSKMESLSKIHLVSVIDVALNDSLTIENIRDLCFKVVIKIKNERVGAAGDAGYVCRLSLNVQRLKRILVEETLKETAKFLGTRICNGILHHFEILVQRKLTEDLERLQFEISDEIHARIQFYITAIIIDIIQSIGNLLFSIGIFFFTIIYPVDINSKEWRSQIAEEVFEKIVVNRPIITSHISKEMMKICSKTVCDLKHIRSQLTDFKSEIYPKDKTQGKYTIFVKFYSGVVIYSLCQKNLT